MSDSALDVLLAEDSQTTAELYLYAIESSMTGVTTRVVRDGVEALDFLLGGAPQVDNICNILPRLVLLDLHMPKVSGLEVLERLRANKRTQSLPIVILSASIERADEQEAYRLGASGYVRKPSTFSESCKTIANIVREWLPASVIP